MFKAKETTRSSSGSFGALGSYNTYLESEKAIEDPTNFGNTLLRKRLAKYCDSTCLSTPLEFFTHIRRNGTAPYKFDMRSHPIFTTMIFERRDITPFFPIFEAKDKKISIYMDVGNLDGCTMTMCLTENGTIQLIGQMTDLEYEPTDKTARYSVIAGKD